MHPLPQGSQPKILILDIETLPYTVTTWSNDPRTPISHDNIVKESEMLCAAWKWLGAPKVYSIMAPRKGGDFKIAQKLQEVISKADAVVAHYGDGFDIPWIQARCLKHNLGPLKPVIQIDTWKIARSKFKIFNNKLDYLGIYLGVGKKLKTDFDLWKRCLAGKKGARKKMLRYNKEDVRLLERVYERIKPFAPAKLNQTHFVDDAVLASRTCPSCGEPRLQRWGYTYTRATIRVNLKCAACGAWCYRVGHTRPR